MPALRGGQGGAVAIERRQQNRQIGIAGTTLGQAAEPVGMTMPEAADTGPCGRKRTPELPQYITCVMLCASGFEIRKLRRNRPWVRKKMRPAPASGSSIDQSIRR